MYTVLTIDDEAAVRDGFKLALEDYDNIEVYEAENGLEGVNLFKEKQPDLVFLDLKMPVMNGAEALKAIRELNTEVPVYVVTAFAKEFFEDLESLRDAGMTFDVAAKPLSLLQIEQIVNAVLKVEG